MFLSSVLGEMRIGLYYPYKDLVVEARKIMPFYVEPIEF
jgi:hypothetical protein